eukprot:Awhi_evm1s14831
MQDAKTGVNGKEVYLKETMEAYATCDDGILNGYEEGTTDCGGICGPCFNCNDGMQNGDEQGVDCGDSCAYGNITK